jgi:CRP/FNR family transcriptional regulator, anaerobic regulatory protein
MERFKKEEITFQAGATILRESEASAHFFTLLEGWVFRYKTLADGRRQILNYGLPGDLIGLQAALLDVMQHSIDALTPVRLCVFSRDALWDLFTGFPSLAFDVTWLASRQERLLDDQLLTIGQRRADERIAFVVMQIFRRAQLVELTAGSAFTLPLTQQHLADTLGFSLVHTNKTLKRMEARGLLRWRGRLLHLIDLQRLSDLAQLHDPTAATRPLL